MIPTRYGLYQGLPIVTMHILRDSVEIVCADVNNPISVLDFRLQNRRVVKLITETTPYCISHGQLLSETELIELVHSSLLQVQLRLTQFQNDRLYRHLMTGSASQDMNLQYSFIRNRIVAASGSSIALFTQRVRVTL